ncbi:hypothetical protein NLI96_g11250 [Meripilus lineatus]|uniref:Uncharacterized protein n=1 Tax=Meripilus lineatus TaxID=2056292 RepID=A0AAD5USF7_9APHY|nr:hypothetical protein NLI96_g11250 [Physisporinus lineatus]
MSYAPPGETAAELWLERSYFVGGFLAAVAYGIHCSIFGACAYFLLHDTNPQKRSENYKLLCFVSFIWAVATINLGTGIKWNQMMWIDDRNYPGGPLGFLFGEFSLPVNTLGSTSYVVNNCLTDLMVLYRCFVIWGNNYLIVLIPFLAIVTSTILSVLTLVQSALPGANLWTRITFSFAVPYWSLSISINILLTLMIIYRLVTTRNLLISALGKEHARDYTSLIAVTIESASIYSIVSLIYIVAFARNSAVQNLCLPVLGQLMCIAPELIILRMAFGTAFSRETATSLSNSRHGRTSNSVTAVAGTGATSGTAGSRSSSIGEKDASDSPYTLRLDVPTKEQV